MDPLTRLLFRGTVISSKDSGGLGRVSVRAEGYEQVVHESVRVVQPAASGGSGYVFLPEEGDEVVFMKTDGDGGGDEIYLLGCVYNGQKKPAQANSDGKNDIKEIRTRSGNLLRFEDGASGAKVRIEVGGSEVFIDLSQSGAKIVVSARQSIVVDSQGTVEVNAKGNVSVVGGTVSIRGGSVDIQGTG